MLKVLLNEVKEFKKDSILTPMYMIFEVIFETIIPLIMGYIITELESGDTSLSKVYTYGGIMLLLAIGALFTGIMGGVHGARASVGFGRNLRKAMYRNIQTFSFSNIDKFSTSSLVTRMTTDTANVQMAYQMIIRVCFRAPIMLIAALVMSFISNWRMAFIFVGAIIVLGGALTVIIKKSFPKFEYVFERYDDVNEKVQENLTGIRVVKAYVREDHENGKFKKASDFLYRKFVEAESIAVLDSPVMSFTMYTCMILIFWFGASLIVKSGGVDMQVGQLTSFMSYTMNIMFNLMMISFIFVMLTIAKTSAQRIVEVLDEEPDMVSPENAVTEVRDGELVFDHVNFSYSKNPLSKSHF